MADVYDSWMALDQVPYDEWCDFILERMFAAPMEVQRVIDIGCGTGSMLQRFRAAGLEVAGVDASPGMTSHASRKLGDEVPILTLAMPDQQVLRLGKAQAVTACFDALNYLVEPNALEHTIQLVAELLEVGGRFVFDLNTRYKLETIFASYTTGADHGDFAYVWRNDYDAGRSACDMEVSFFVRNGDHFVRTTEHHTERWFSDDTIESALHGAGLVSLEVVDCYSSKPCGPETLRATWVAEKVGSSTSAVRQRRHPGSRT